MATDWSAGSPRRLCSMAGEWTVAMTSWDWATACAGGRAERRARETRSAGGRMGRILREWCGGLWVVLAKAIHSFRPYHPSEQRTLVGDPGCGLHEGVRQSERAGAYGTGG